MNPKIKKYKFQEVQNILECEYPIDEPVTDTKMSALCLASALPDDDSLKEKNKQMLEILLEKNASINYLDKFLRTPLHLAASTGNMTAIELLV